MSKIIDTSNYDINKWRIPSWLKGIWNKHPEYFENMVVKLIPTKEVDTRDYFNYARYGGLDDKVVDEIRAGLVNPDIGYYEDEEPCVVFEKQFTIDRLSKPLKYAPPCSFHRIKASEDSISHIPAVVIILKKGLREHQEKKIASIIGSKEHLRIKPLNPPSNDDHASGIYNQIIHEEVEVEEKGKITQRLLTESEQRELLKEKIKELPFDSKKKKNISDKVEQLFKWYEPIVQRTTPKALQDWVDRDYDKSFDYRGDIIDTLDLSMTMVGGFYKSQNPISSLPNLDIVAVSLDDGSEERDRQRLEKNFKYDFENKLERIYFLFLSITSNDRIGNLNENRIKFSKSVEKHLEWICKHPNIHRNKIHIIGFLPQDPTKRVDDTMSSLIDYVEFKRDNGI